MKSLLADALLVAHVLFIAFVVVGQACILVGAVRHWRWIRNPAFRTAHLIAIAVVVLESWAGVACPLTVWEDAFRVGANDTVHAGTFVGRWVSKLVFYDAPDWVFTTAYTLFCLIVVASWVLVRPMKSIGPRSTAALTPRP